MLTALLVLGLLFGLYMAWNIGANDVANAMGTSVGSHALTLGQAIAVAAVFEFAGSVFVGTHVSETVKKGIVDVERMPDAGAFMAVMVGALLAAGLWLQLATWRGWPVSTTHSIVGAVAGGGVAVAGLAGVDWVRLGWIGVTWIASPLLGGAIAFVLFRGILRWIINSRTPRMRTRRLAPVMVAVVAFVLALSVVYKGLKNLHLDLPIGRASALAGGVALLFGLATTLVSWRHPLKRNRTPSRFGYIERQFRGLQIATACYVAFAHGANDVANAVGPVAGVWSAYVSGGVAAKAPVPLWILTLGGAGIVVGLATWGYKVMDTIGRKITALTPSRGFCAEFAAATTVLVCSKAGIPISTTHTLVGSVIGVGLARGLAALDRRVVRDIFGAWIVTLPASFLLSALLVTLLRAVL
ncbi:MAG: anion permease [Acidobacteria bacterium]|nr:MAG: anion permease [Acidobacteriota bacterium]